MSLHGGFKLLVAARAVVISLPLRLRCSSFGRRILPLVVAGLLRRAFVCSLLVAGFVCSLFLLLVVAGLLRWAFVCSLLVAGFVCSLPLLLRLRCSSFGRRILLLVAGVLCCASSRSDFGRRVLFVVAVLLRLR